MDDKRIVIARKDDVILAFWPSNTCKYVTALINEKDNYKPGDTVTKDWFHGHYHLKLENAVEEYLERCNEKDKENSEETIPKTNYLILQLASKAVIELKNTSDWQSKMYTYGYLLEYVLKIPEKEVFEVLDFMGMEYSDYE